MREYGCARLLDELVDEPEVIHMWMGDKYPIDVIDAAVDTGERTV